MAVAEAANFEPVLDGANRAVDRGDANIEHRNLDLAAAARALAFEESGEDARGKMHPRAGVDEGGGDAYARAISVAGHADDAGGGLDGEIHRSELREAAVTAVAFAGSEDETRKARSEIVVAEAEAFERARGVVLEQDIRLGEHTEEDVAAARILDVESDRLLARVEHQEAVVGAVFGGRALAQKFTVSGRFYLDNLSAQMGQLEATVRARVNLGEFDDAVAMKRQIHTNSRPH